jgi:hypothetical protein
MNDIGLRKRKSTEFLVPLPNQKIASIRSLEHGLNISATRIKNKYYLENNISKLCVEGAIGNLMNILNCSEEDMNLFWSIVTSTMQSIPSMLGETFVKKLFKSMVVDMIQFRSACGFYVKKLTSQLLLRRRACTR